MAEIVRINEQTYRIEDGGVRFFVLTGSEGALMIDSGMNTPDARALAETVTDKPLALLNTHADIDHISGNDGFDEVYIHPGDAEKLLSQGKRAEIIPVFDGQMLDLGSRPLKIIALSGHTPGSIALLDENARVLYGGDSIQDGRIFMFGDGRDLDGYIASLERLVKENAALFDVIYPSHGSPEVKPELVSELIDAAKSIRSGAAKGSETEFFGQKIMYYDFGFAGFLCDK